MVYFIMASPSGELKNLTHIALTLSDKNKLMLDYKHTREDKN